MIGFTCRAFLLYRCESSPIPLHFSQYPIQIIVLAAATNGLLHCFDSSSGFVFYYLAFSICLYGGFYVDFWEKKLGRFLGKSLAAEDVVVVLGEAVGLVADLPGRA
jgi:hypothetical protein